MKKVAVVVVAGAAVAAAAAAVVLTVVPLFGPRVTVTPPSGPMALAAHKAFYRLSMASASSDSNMTGVEGAISFEIRDVCDAWVVEQNYAMRFMLANGGEIDSLDKYVSHESKDGLEYRFNIKRETNGEETERIDGRAELESPGGPGMAIFEQPTRDRIALSGGTVFPNEHTVSLLDKAAKGGKIDRRLVFDGSQVAPAAPVTAIVVGQRAPGDGSVVKAPLGPDPAWLMQLSFYAAEGTAEQGEELPTFAMSMEIQPNGIVTGLVLDFGGFKVDGVLERIETLPGGDC